MNYQVISETTDLNYLLVIEIATTLKEMGYQNILELYCKLPNEDMGVLRRMYSDVIMLEVLELIQLKGRTQYRFMLIIEWKNLLLLVIGLLWWKKIG